MIPPSVIRLALALHRWPLSWRLALVRLIVSRAELERAVANYEEIY